MLVRGGGSGGTEFEARRSVAPQGDLRAVHLEHAGVPSGSAQGGDDRAAWNEAEFHQASGNVLGQVEVVEDALFALAQFHEAGGRTASPDTRLHQDTVSNAERQRVKAVSARQLQLRSGPRPKTVYCIILRVPEKGAAWKCHPLWQPREQGLPSGRWFLVALAFSRSASLDWLEWPWGM